MDPFLERILTRQLVRSLPAKQRDVYTYVTSREDQAAIESLTSQGFLDLLMQQSLYTKAARKFRMTEEQLHILLKQTELTIINKLRQIETQWDDYTDHLKIEDDQMLFYFRWSEKLEK